MVSIAAALAILFVAAVSLKLYLKLTRRWCASQVCLVGKTAIVTGASAGIDYETALDFAKRGARVILACRNRTKAEHVKEKIINETGNRNILIKTVDLSSFGSVRAFAKDVNETVDRLDILVNNAGAAGIEGKKTADDLPWLMQVNYFSSVLLTLLLIDLLKKSAPSRIINVSSIAAKYAKRFDINSLDKNLPSFEMYAYSKLGNILFTQELANKLQGTEVKAYSLHPGLVATDIFDNISGVPKYIFSAILPLYSITSDEGAQTTVHCSVANGIEEYNGDHFENCKRIRTYKTARDPSLSGRLWTKTVDLIGLKPNENPF